MDRLDLYLHSNLKEQAYQNTAEEERLVQKFVALYQMAKNAKESNMFANTENIQKWRKAYYGILNALKDDGSVSETKQKALRRLVYEDVESKVDNDIPKPKMTVKHKMDLPLIEVTEDYLKYCIEESFTKFSNDKSERATYVDGTVWYKVSWDSLHNNATTNGEVKVSLCTADQIVPQPGILDYHDLEYIFEIQQVSISKLYDLYGRIIEPTSSNTSKPADENTVADMSTVTAIYCYYLNENGIVGLFAWAEDSGQVICNIKDWQIRKLRTCTACNTVVPQSDVCPVCGTKTFKFKNAEMEVLDEDLMEIYNPYKAGETDDESKEQENVAKPFLSKGTEIPYYRLRQLPFVPRPAVSSIESIYGVSDVFILLEAQDSINKILNKVEDKNSASGAVVTKPAKLILNNTKDSIKIVNVKTPEEAQMVTVKQIGADTTQDITLAQMFYDNGKAASGITDSFQGKRDTTATSGKAKQFAALQSAGRIESLRVMKAAAWGGVYELMLKYLLAFSDEPRTFIKVLPDGSTEEEEWSKYMFLDKTKYGEVYYRDDFKFNTDPAATLSTDRVAMWQELTEKYIQGAIGNPAEPRTLELFWNMLSEQQYPLAKFVLAGIKDNAQHLPAQIEQFILQNPDIMQQIVQQAQAAQSGTGQGGARPNSGPEGNGATHAANVERTNARNRAADNLLGDNTSSQMMQSAQEATGSTKL